MFRKKWLVVRWLTIQGIKVDRDMELDFRSRRYAEHLAHDCNKRAWELGTPWRFTVERVTDDNRRAS